MKSKHNTQKQAPLNVISLGVGKQSTYLLLNALEGKFNFVPDYCIFVDTGSEPIYVYDYFKFLSSYVKKKYEFTINFIGGQNLELDTLKSFFVNSQLPLNLPFFTKYPNGMLQRQCTYNYKIRPLYKEIQRLRKGRKVNLYIGISYDEIERQKEAKVNYVRNCYPLIEKKTTISQIVEWFKTVNFREPAKSACYFCPFHSLKYWSELKAKHPADFKKACHFDEQIRIHPRFNGRMFLSNKLKPLKDIDFQQEELLFPELISECNGICGI